MDNLFGKDRRLDDMDKLPTLNCILERVCLEGQHQLVPERSLAVRIGYSIFCHPPSSFFLSLYTHHFLPCSKHFQTIFSKAFSKPFPRASSCSSPELCTQNPRFGDVEHGPKIGASAALPRAQPSQPSDRGELFQPKPGAATGWHWLLLIDGVKDGVKDG